MTAVYRERTEQEKREIRMYGVTVAGMKEAVEQSITYRFSGPVMYAMSLMSDCQEMLEYSGENEAAREDVRQMLNRAKWVLCSYAMEQKFMPA